MSLRVRVLNLLVMGILSSGAQAAQTRFSMTSDGHPSNFPGFDFTLNVMTQIPDGPGSFMISAGDNESLDVTRDMITTTFGSSFGWYPVMGNHDIPFWVLKDHDYDGQGNGPVNPGPVGAQNSIYSFDAGPVHIVAINEYWDGANGPEALYYPDIVPETQAWLENDLANNDKKWTLVVGHAHAHPQPDEDWGDGFSWTDTGLNRYPARRDLFWKTLEDYDVMAYVHGHTHRFSHTVPPGSDVWEVSLGRATSADGEGFNQTRNTFVIVEANEN